MNETALPQVLVQVKAFHKLEENVKSLQLFLANLPPKSAAVFASAPYTQIGPIAATLADNGVTIGANDMVSANPATFTGSIAGGMVEVSGSRFVLIPALGANASEEAGAASSKAKIEAALSHNVIPYVTLNETWEEHHDGISKEAMVKRLKKTLEGLQEESLKKLIFVYNAQWILGGLWETSSSDLQSAYARVEEAIQEAFSVAIPSTRTIVSVPSYSTDLASIIAALQNRKDKFLGFLCGDLGPGTTQMQPLFFSQPVPKAETSIPPVLPAKVAKKAEQPPEAPKEAVQAEEPPAKKRRTRAKPSTETPEESKD